MNEVVQRMRQRRDNVNSKRRLLPTFVGLACLCVLSGCFLRKSDMAFDEQLNHFQTMASSTQYPEVEVVIDEQITSDAPLTIDAPKREAWLLSPEMAVQYALANSPVLRELGGQVLHAPLLSRTIHNPAIVETDPRYGVEAALAAFDAEFFGSFYAENNDYVANNQFLGGGTNKLQQDRNVLALQVSKRAATGTEYYLRHNIDYDSNNAPGNLFPSVYNTNVEAEFRHPLLQGGGVEFNRIAGPGATPGNYNGVVIARLNADVALVDFELGLRDLVNNVENAYWDLYFAYRDLEAKVEARDAAKELWQQVSARGNDAGRPDLEPQARELYFRFKEEVQNALSGRVLDGTRTNNGSHGGTFRSTPGVQVAERRLRLLMGVAINDHQMIVPTHEPCAAPIEYDWQQIAAEAIARRAELRRTRTMVRYRELELTASRNFLLPRLDAFGRYRWRGFGDDLLNPTRQGSEFDNAYQELTSGEYQEWRVGAELRFPIGFRQAHSGVRNAQLRLARERALLVEQERQVVHDLSNSVADLKRSYETLQAALNRRIAAQKQVSVLLERKNLMNLDLWINAMLDARQRLADATVRYHATRVEYIVAVKNLHLEKGTLLEYNNIFLAEDMPAVVAPTTPAATPGSEGAEELPPGTVAPGQLEGTPAVPETTLPERSGADFQLPERGGVHRGGPAFESGPNAAPPDPNTTTSDGAPATRSRVLPDPTPISADLRAARERAQFASQAGTSSGQASMSNSDETPVVITAPGTPRLPFPRLPNPNIAGEGEGPDGSLDTPPAPTVPIRDMWARGGYGDPSVAVPDSTPADRPAEVLAELPRENARGAVGAPRPVIAAPADNTIQGPPPAGLNRPLPAPPSQAIPVVPDTAATSSPSRVSTQGTTRRRTADPQNAATVPQAEAALYGTSLRSPPTPPAPPAAATPNNPPNNSSLVDAPEPPVATAYEPIGQGYGDPSIAPAEAPRGRPSNARAPSLANAPSDAIQYTPALTPSHPVTEATGNPLTMRSTVAETPEPPAGSPLPAVAPPRGRVNTAQLPRLAPPPSIVDENRGMVMEPGESRVESSAASLPINAAANSPPKRTPSTSGAPALQHDAPLPPEFPNELPAATGHRPSTAELRETFGDPSVVPSSGSNPSHRAVRPALNEAPTTGDQVRRLPPTPRKVMPASRVEPANATNRVNRADYWQPQP